MCVYKEILQVIMKADRSGSLLCCVTLEKIFISFRSQPSLICFIWSRTELLHWFCYDFVYFLRYLSKWFGTEDVSQHWKQKYQEVCNALDMVGFQEQVSSGIALFIPEFSILLPKHLNLLRFVTARAFPTGCPCLSFTFSPSGVPTFCILHTNRFSVTLHVCFRNKWICRQSWLVCCHWAMWPSSLRRAMGL